jgi:hypothetical protein
LIGIRKEFQTYPVKELLGIATISSDIEASIRRETELAGMQAVLKHGDSRAEAEEESRKIRDVSERDVGYDVESFDRLIEVKSFKITGSVRLTNHEWETAKRLKDDYWLYVVETVFDKPVIRTFQNPSNSRIK